MTGRSPQTQRLLLALAGVFTGWGLARLAPIIANQWSLIETARNAFRDRVPLWAWVAFLLLAGAYLFWVSNRRENASTPSDFANENHASGSKSHQAELQNQSPPPQPTLTGQRLSNHQQPSHVQLDSERQSSYRNGTVLNLNGASISSAKSSVGPSTDSKSVDVAQRSPDSRPQPEYEQLEFPKDQGPRIVAIGGGTGMPQLLRGLRAYTDNITAIVTVADDGGSSGRLRFMGMLPPGDFRNNIAALSESEDLITRLFQYRFAQSQLSTDDVATAAAGGRTGLAGHNFGNLFIATMAAVTGSFESGLAESSRVLAVKGRVLPSTLEQVTLCAEICRPVQDNTASGASSKAAPGESESSPLEVQWLLVEGESEIPDAGGTIQRVFLKPQSPRAYPEAIRAILQADLILAGPGSFYTSIIPNLLVPAVRDAIVASGAPSLYLCNVASQKGETDGYSVSKHMHQLRLHAGDAFTDVLANHAYDESMPLHGNSDWIPLPPDDATKVEGSFMQVTDRIDGQQVAYRLFTGDLVDDNAPSKHDSAKLAERVMELYTLLKNHPKSGREPEQTHSECSSSQNYSNKYEEAK